MIVPNVMLLTSYGCTPCLRIKRILNELQAEMPNLCVEEVEFKSASGSKLSFENSVLYPPAVFLDGKLLVKGKIDAEKMIAAIRGRRQDA
jgi:predicted thioredoxin/glutaredoxin